MNQTDIETFLAVISYGSLTKASEHLHLTQPSISHRLKSLEESLGVILIERDSGFRNLKLTEKGEEFLKIAEKMQILYEQSSNIKNENLVISFSVGSVDSLNNFIFNPLYKTFSSHGGIVNLKVLTHKSTQIYDLVDNNEIDLGFVIRKLRYQSIASEFLFEERMVLIISGENSLTHSLKNEKVKTSDLNPRNELFVDWGPDHNAWHDYWFNSGVLPRLVIDTPSMINYFIEDYDSWSIVPISVAREFLKFRNIKIIELKDPPPLRMCYKIENKYQRSHETGRNLFESYLKNYMDKIRTLIEST